MYQIQQMSQRGDFIICKLVDTTNNETVVENVTIDYCISLCHHKNWTIENAQEVLFSLHKAGNTFKYI